MIESGDVIKIVLPFIMPDNVIAQLVMNYIMTIGTDQDEIDVLDDILTQLLVAWLHIEDHVVDGVAGDVAKLSIYDTVLDQWDEKASQAMTGFDGASVGEMLPHGAAAVIRFFTEVGRRQGRKFIMGLDESSQVDGTLVASAVTDLVFFALDWDDVVTSGDASFKPCTYNELLEDHEGFVQSIAVNTVIGYQRRRKAGVGI